MLKDISNELKGSCSIILSSSDKVNKVLSFIRQKLWVEENFRSYRLPMVIHSLHSTTRTKRSWRIVSSKIMVEGPGEMAQWFRVLTALSEDPHGGLQPFISLVTGNMTLSHGLCGHQAYKWYTHICSGKIP